MPEPKIGMLVYDPQWQDDRWQITRLTGSEIHSIRTRDGQQTSWTRYTWDYAFENGLLVVDDPQRPQRRPDYLRTMRLNSTRGGQGWIQAVARERDRVVREVSEARGALQSALWYLGEASADEYRLSVDNAQEDILAAVDMLDALLGTLGEPQA
jgi:hypothetical protein